MLPSKQRLSKNRIQYLFKKGRKLVSKAFLLKHLTTSEPQSRFCVIISAKTESSAVKRNLIRRRVYEALRLQNHLLENPQDVVIITNKKILDMTYQEIEADIKEIFTKSIKPYLPNHSQNPKSHEKKHL